MHANFAKVLVRDGEQEYLVMFRLEKSIWTGSVAEFKAKAEVNKLSVGYCKPPSDHAATEMVVKYLKVRNRDK